MLTVWLILLRETALLLIYNTLIIGEKPQKNFVLRFFFENRNYDHVFGSINETLSIFENTGTFELDGDLNEIL